MLIVMHQGAPADAVSAVVARIRALGLTPHAIPGSERVAIGITGNKGAVEREQFLGLPHVADAIAVSQPFKLVSREVKSERTRVPVAGTVMGQGFCFIAGPCSVESREQLLECAHAVKEAGATLLRGGAYKPRTSPYEFQGLKEAGLELLALAREQTGLGVVTEVVSPDTVEVVARYADMLQIGARNMQNFALLEAVGEQRKPVLLKRGMSATIKEWLMAAEYIVSRGNYQVVLCERGIRTFETMTRNTLDLGAVPVLRTLTHLPIVVDPSHGIGRRDGIIPLARAAAAVGADGVIVEVHPDPDRALSDGHQSLRPSDFASLVRQVRMVFSALDEC